MSDEKESDYKFFTRAPPLSDKKTREILDKFHPEKASGGEKSHIGNLSDVEKSKITDDSKPPEFSERDRKIMIAMTQKPEPKKEILNVLKPIKAGDTIILDVGDKVILPREDLYTCRLCGNEITLVEHEASKLTREVTREDLHDVKKFLGYIHDSRGIDVSNFKERAYELWKRIKEAYNIE